MTPEIVAFGTSAVEAVDYAAAVFPGGHTVTPGNTLLFFAFGTTDQHFTNVEHITGPWTQVAQTVCYPVGDYPPIVVACFAVEIPTDWPLDAYEAGYNFSFNLPEATDECNATIIEISQAGPLSAFQFAVTLVEENETTYTTPTLTPIAPETIPFTGAAFVPNFPTFVDTPAGYTSLNFITINELASECFYGPSTPDMEPVGPLSYTVSSAVPGLAFLCLVPPSPNLNQLDAHLRISPAQLILIPPDATLPFNQTLLYKVRKQYATGYSAIPRGVFVSTAGTMNPSGVTSTGQAVLTPYEDTIGPFTVTFYEVL